MTSSQTYAGYIAIIGRPNVGKSTLLNRILGRKVSITARKAQTTRHKILGIKTIANWQAIYVDTPGLQNKIRSRLSHYMNMAALSVLTDVDVVIVVVGTIWRQEDELVLQSLRKISCPVILVINKIDMVKQKKQLLESIQQMSQKHQFAAVVPLAAQNGVNLPALEQEVQKVLPRNPFFFSAEQITDQDDKFLIAEIIREKLTRFLGEELPYVLSVVIDQLVTKSNVLRIAATIYVERRGQKIIILGKNGEGLKRIGTLARKELENLFSQKVFLQLWVKVKNDWTNNQLLLQQFGYDNRVHTL